VKKETILIPETVSDANVDGFFKFVIWISMIEDGHAITPHTINVQLCNKYITTEERWASGVPGRWRSGFRRHLNEIPHQSLFHLE
jgi:hypothetical protein